MATGMATTIASPAASRSVRSCNNAPTEGLTPRVNSMAMILPACPAYPALVLRRRLRLIREKALNLFHRVVDLDIELHLAERRGRFPRVAGDAVVLARRRGPRRGSRVGAARRVRIRLSAAAPLAARAGRRHRIAFSRRDQLFPHPAFVAAEIQHRRRVGNA